MGGEFQGFFPLALSLSALTQSELNPRIAQKVLKAKNSDKSPLFV
jgi:hypothetical protein